jgi:hypothetical protein
MSTDRGPGAQQPRYLHAKKKPANEAVAQTLALPGFVVRGGIDDFTEHPLDRRVTGGRELRSV